MLSNEQIDSYQKNGFLIIPNFISPAVCCYLIERANQLIEEYDHNTAKVIFSTQDQKHAKHQYFLDSSDNIHFFFEEQALDAQGNLKCPKRLAINKIGHALHDLDPVFDCFSRMHCIANLVQDLKIENPLLLQSMYICKQPFIGGEVNCHQDSTYLYVEGNPVVGLWFALQEATIANGCLWAIPGGHQTFLKSRMKRDKNNHLITEIYDHSPWPESNMVPLEVSQGSVIILHGLLPHKSEKNTSPHSRHAYTLHVISAQQSYSYENWLQRSSHLPWRGFF